MDNFVKHISVNQLLVEERETEDGVKMSANGSLPHASVSLELDSYKEKVEHFKVLIRHLQQDLQSYKVRSQGAETVSKLLQEARQENQILNKKYKALYAAANNLKSRLEANGLSSDIVLQEDEIHLPGNSKQLLDNLTRENKRLRSLIRDCTGGDPEEIHRNAQEHIEKDQKIDHLSQANHNLESRVAELEGILASSSDQKDLTIQNLREALVHAQRTCNTRDSLCTSLAEEATTLRKQLRDVAERCQEMAQQLEERETNVKKMKQTVLQNGDNLSDTSDVKALLAEKLELQNKVADISAMNNRWQTYCMERERALQSKIAEMSQELHQKNSSSGSSNVDVIRQQVAQELTQEMNKVLDEARKSEQQLNSERSQYKAQLEQTQAQMAQVAERNRQLEDQMRNMGRRLSREDSETMEALKQQIQVCTEDFESERKDREKAQAKIAKLETEIDQMKKENGDLRRRQTSTPMQYGYYDQGYNNYNVPAPYAGLQESTLAARGINYNVADSKRRQNLNVADNRSGRSSRASDGSPVRANDVDTDETRVLGMSRAKSIDDDNKFLSLSVISDDERLQSFHRESPPPLQHSPVARSTVGGPSPGTSPKQSEMLLRCPKCGKEYKSELHADLLEHIEMCCE